MGVVYEAFDTERSDRVALKTLPQVEADALARFKNEFRSLADVTHPNLAALYELHSDGDDWFFTMELVHGFDFVHFVRMGPVEVAVPLIVSDSVATRQRTSSPPVDDWSNGAAAPAVDDKKTTDIVKTALGADAVGRLRPCLRQLAEGMAALHAAGKLHCDIKPSNTMVTAAGRVVLLDFGLATDLGLRHATEGRVIAGTANYMSPEQAEGRPLTAATDWYALGTMLFEALTGRLPFEGPPDRVRRVKRERDGDPPSIYAEGVPEDLDTLCAGLLRRQPEDRPSGRDILAALGAAHDTAASPPTLETVVGRSSHFAQLQGAYAAMSRGRAVTVHVRGQSGAGKSFLVRRFLSGIDASSTVILEGRCYEGETVPYKALDTVMDGLSGFLSRLKPGDAAPLMPRDVHALARVFPVLERVPAVAEAPRRGADVPNRQELRRRAFGALRELLARIGDRRPLVLAIDDMQWGDHDSASLLTEVLRPPDPPRLLLVALYRSEHATTSPFLREFLSVQAEPGLERRDIVVESLEYEDTVELASALLSRHGSVDPALAERIARESGGVPFFVHELAQYMGEGGVEGARAFTLDEVVSRRVDRLTVDARHLLEAIAVSAMPLSQRDACNAAGIERDPRRALAALRVGHLVKTTGPSERDLVEAYHDRIRELVAERLPAGERRDCHLRLATTLQSSERADPEAIGVHFEGAEQPSKAAEYYVTAGQRASESLAFERAARLFRRSLELDPPRIPESLAALRSKLADALANAGRGLEAAREYERACAALDDDRGFELRGRAAYQYCITGHLDEGRTALRGLLRRVGLRMPTSRMGMIVRLVLNRLRLRLRGIGYKRRAAANVPQELLRRTDVTWIASAGLSMFDTVAGTAFQARNALDALDSGEPSRVVRALAWEAVVGANSGRAARPRALELLGAASSLAEETQDAYSLAMCSLARGVTEFVIGNWAAACPLLDDAEETFRSRCTGVTWEINTANSFNLWALVHRGELARMGQRATVLLKEADERGDRNASITMQSFMMSHSRLMADDVAGARRDVDDSLARFSCEGYQLQHINALWMRSYIDFYEGAGPDVGRRIEREWPGVKQSFLLRSLVIRSFFSYLKARGALEAGAAPAKAKALLRTAEREAVALVAEGVPWTVALALLIRAGVAARRGDRSGACEHLSAAESALDAAGMAGFAAAARHRRGQTEGGPAGAALVESAAAWMRSQNVANPSRMADLHVPSMQ